MKTLFNFPELPQMEQHRQNRPRCHAEKVSKISRPNLRGIASYAKTQCAVAIAISTISAHYCGQVIFLNEQAYDDGTAIVIAQVWEDGENVLYQFDIDEYGDFTEIKL